MVYMMETGSDPTDRRCTFVSELHDKLGAKCSDQVLPVGPVLPDLHH